MTSVQKIKLISGIFIVGLLLTVAAISQQAGVPATTVITRREPTKIIEPLNEFVKKVIVISQAKTTGDFRDDILVEKITRITSKYLTVREEQEAFIILLSIESRFARDATSPVGAVGLGQLMPRYAVAFAEEAGLQVTSLSGKDLLDEDVNLTLAAAHFAALLKETKSITLSLAAYNAGFQSATMKKADAGVAINLETANYITKFAVTKEKLQKKTKK